MAQLLRQFSLHIRPWQTARTSARDCSSLRLRRAAAAGTQPHPISRTLFASLRGLPRNDIIRDCRLGGHPISISRRAYAAKPCPPNAEPGVYHTTHSPSPNNEIATVTIHNPLKLNILSAPILDQLIQTCNSLSLSPSPSLRAVILTSSTPPPGSQKHPSFIGGADIKEMSQLSSRLSAEEFITKIHSACRALRALPVPVIARIHGFTLGAGLEVMISCDLRIATDPSTFGMPEVRVGIPSVVEASLLPPLIGTGLTRRLLYLGETITASTAFQWGLVEKVVPDQVALDVAVQEWIDGIVHAGPRAIRIQKRLMRAWENAATMDDAIRAGIGAFGEAYADGGTEPKEYMSRFINRSRAGQ